MLLQWKKSKSGEIKKHTSRNLLYINALTANEHLGNNHVSLSCQHLTYYILHISFFIQINATTIRYPERQQEIWRESAL